jgi:nucleotide-binding universal stress UspA family protein
MYSKIIIASDLSDASTHVISCIQDLKKLGTKEVILFHALGIRHLQDMRYELARYAEPVLQKQKESLESLGFSVKINIATESAAYELWKLAKNENASLVVIGTHGRGMAFDVLLGGTAHKIIHGMLKPLLVVRLNLVEGPQQSCTADCIDISKPVFYATDFSDTAELAFTYVEKMAESGLKSATLVHIQDKSRIDRHLKDRLDEFNTIDTERLEMLKERLQSKGVKDIKIVLKYGMPAEEILKASKDDEYSMIVMGAQGRSIVKDVFLGSVSWNVLQNASHPVFLVPALK